MQDHQISHLFNSLGPVNGKLSGKAVHAFLLTSNIPPHSLKDIWSRADQDKDGHLTLHEFSIALQLIQNFKRGFNAAAINSMNAIPMQHLQLHQQQQNMQQNMQLAHQVHLQAQQVQQAQQSQQTQQQIAASLSRSNSFKSQQPTLAAATANWSSFSADQASKHSSPMKAGASSATLPASISNEMWVVDLNAKKRYLLLFNRLDNRRNGSVPGSVVKGEFVKSGLTAQTLSEIWSLSDISKTGSLSADEFCLAMYLVENAQRGKDPPARLTPALVPPQYRHFLLKDRTETQPDSIFTKASFENKKQVNFDKGEAELERRRHEIKEKQRKEKEDKEAVAAASQELERQKAELQARRQLEFQKQRTKSMEAAAHIRQQQEQEQQTLYRSKMESWAESRKQQLEGQLSRLRDLTTGLRTRKLLLDKELADLLARRDRNKVTLNNFMEEKTRIFLDIDKLNRQKQEIINEVNSARLAVQSSQSEVTSVANDKVRLFQQLRAKRNPDEVMITILDDQEKAKQSLISLKSEHTDILVKTGAHQTELDDVTASRQDVIQILLEREKELASKQSLLEKLTENKKQFEVAERAKIEREQAVKEAERTAKEQAVKEAKRTAKEQAVKEAEYAAMQQEHAVKEAERAAQEKFKLEEKMRLEKMKTVNESLQRTQEAEKVLSDFERVRVQSVKFNEFQSHSSDDAAHSHTSDDAAHYRKSKEDAALAKKLAAEAREKKQDRFKELIENERKRNTCEQEEFYARASSLPRTPRKRPELPKIPSGSTQKQRTPQKLNTPEKVVTEAPTIDCLISFDTPQAENKPAPNFFRDLSLVLSSSPVSSEEQSLGLQNASTPQSSTPYSASTPKRSTYYSASTPYIVSSAAPNVDKVAGGLQVTMPEERISTLQFVEQKEGCYQNTEQVTQGSENDYSIYMNVDPTGLLHTTSTDNNPHSRVSEQKEEHIYALASEVVKKPQISEVLFEVETLGEHKATNTEELSYNKGDRISVYEIRGSSYFGGLDSLTGLVAIRNTEKCEWIYGEFVERAVVALYDYQSEVEGDLCFSAGEVISVTEELGEWYRGYIEHRSGIFPGNFVEEKEQFSTPPPSSALPTAEIKPINTGVVIESYATEYIELEKGDAVSVLAQADEINMYIQNIAGKRAWVRADLIKLDNDVINDVIPSEIPQNGPIGADRIPASLHCFSIYPYSAQNNDELTLKVNDVITITEQSDPHWWIGRLGAEVGVLPANYVEQINDQITWETVRAWNANLSAAEGERTRQEAIHELISTEKTYIDDLLLVVEVFYNPLCSVATEEELTSVFVNWMQLILCNARLFRSLYNSNDVNCFETVGSVFLEEIDSLVVPYTKFCSAQRQAMIALQESVSPVFKVKETECATSPKVGKLPLSTFLLKPMQRITKYPLLIKKILQHTRDTHPDYCSLGDSLARTEYLLTTVNEAVRATSRLETLQRAFVKCSEDLGERVTLHSATNCLGPRKLTHFGSLSKTKGSKEMFAVLFTDMLWIAKVDKGRYGNKSIDLDARDFDSVKFEYYRDPFLLNNMSMTESGKSSAAEQTFHFSYNDKNYCFYCNSASDATDWSDHLHGAIRNAVLLYHSHYKVYLPDPTVSGQATLTLRIVEALELSLPQDEKSTSIFAQASLHGHVQRTPVSGPKWDHTVHFVLTDLNSDKINISLYKEFTFSPNLLLGKFDLSVQKLIKSGPGPWNKRLILTDTNSGMVNVSILLRYHGNR